MVNDNELGYLRMMDTATKERERGSLSTTLLSKEDLCMKMSNKRLIILGLSLCWVMFLSGVAPAVTLPPSTGFVFGTNSDEPVEGFKSYPNDPSLDPNDPLYDWASQYRWANHMQVLISTTRTLGDTKPILFPTSVKSFYGILKLWPDQYGKSTFRFISGAVYPDGKVFFNSSSYFWNSDNSFFDYPGYGTWLGDAKITNVGTKNRPNYKLIGHLYAIGGLTASFSLTLQDTTYLVIP
jgi:hypothetical protein